MTDHADTISRALSALRSERRARSSLATLQDVADAESALAALLAERQQAIDERDAARKERDKWYAATLDADKAAHDLSCDVTRLGTRCEQAIDDVKVYREEVRQVTVQLNQAIDERDAAYNTCGTCGAFSGRCESGCEECAEFAQESGWAAVVAAADDRCEQAIDALRDLHLLLDAWLHTGNVPDREYAYAVVEGAGNLLLNLGETE